MLLIPTPSPTHGHSKRGRWEIVHSMSLQCVVLESLKVSSGAVSVLPTLLFLLLLKDSVKLCTVS